MKQALRMRLRCTRCSRSVPRQCEGWNVTMVSGVVTEVIRPRCQSAEENAEAEINDATLNYFKDGFGLFRSKCKVPNG